MFYDIDFFQIIIYRVFQYTNKSNNLKKILGKKMDKDIIKMLNIRLKRYEKSLSEISSKDSKFMAEYAHNNYVLPIKNFILPFIKVSIFNKRNTFNDYLGYIKKEYQEEIKNYAKIEENFSPVQAYANVAKLIVQEYSKTVMNFQNSSFEEKEEYVNDFCLMYELQLEKIAASVPILALNIIAHLRTPALQFNLVRNPSILEPIKKTILNKLIHQDWNDWMEEYFSYPRTSSMEEYMNKWVARQKIHIKHSKMLFDQHYEAVKIWLKSKEKLRERRSASIDLKDV